MRQGIDSILGRKSEESSDDEVIDLDEETAAALIEMMCGIKLSKKDRKDINLNGLVNSLMEEKEKLGDDFEKENALDLFDRISKGNVDDDIRHTMGDQESTQEALDQTSESTVGNMEKSIKAVRKIPKPVGTIRNKESRVGRNDPCPCGSGKKHKQCCGRKA